MKSKNMVVAVLHKNLKNTNFWFQLLMSCFILFIIVEANATVKTQNFDAVKILMLTMVGYLLCFHFLKQNGLLEKQSKRMEYYLANGANVKTILRSSALISFYLSMINVICFVLLISVVYIKRLSFDIVYNTIVIAFMLLELSILVNILLLKLKDNSKYQGIFNKGFVICILLGVPSYLLSTYLTHLFSYSKIGNVATLSPFIIFVIALALLNKLLLKNVTAEDIVLSYY